MPKYYSHNTLHEIINKIYEDRNLLSDPECEVAVHETIHYLDKGDLRVVESISEGTWKINQWKKNFFSYICLILYTYCRVIKLIN